MPSNVEEALPKRPDDSEAVEVDQIDEPPDTTADEIHPYRDDLAPDRVRDPGDYGEVVLEPSANEKELVEGTGAAGYSGDWSYPREPNSWRITSSVRSDLIYDRNK